LILVEAHKDVFEGRLLELEIEERLNGRTDRVRFEQLVGNLLSNAIKYGDGNPIEVALSGDDSTVELTVRDHGIGIAPEHQDQIFERFHRIEGEETDDSFGLGLWIVKRSVQALDGTITFDSEPGEGTEFRVRLPRHPDT
jgi:signal transduction histidine kinase